MVLKHIKGMDTVLKGFKKKDKEIAKKFERGMKKAGLKLQRESQKVVPIDTGALRASAFTRAEGKGFEVQVFVGYTASYAIYVHENLEAAHAPGKQAKFLEGPYRKIRKDLLEIVREEMRRK